MRTLADTALDSLCDAVVVIDAHRGHLPVVLANSTARRCLTAEPADCLLESSLNHWLAAASVSTLEGVLADPLNFPASVGQVLTWRFVEGEMPLMTDVTPLVSSSTERLIMLTFAPEAERRLARREELLRVTTANTTDTLLLVDTSLRVCFINKDVGGMSIEQIIGREIDVLLPPAARDRVLGKLRKIFDSGETASYEFESTEGDQVRYFENRAVPVRNRGIGTGISIAIRDITERKRLEQEILDVGGRERQSIGRDLHDGLGQELTGAALMVRSLASQVPQDSRAARDSINKIARVLNQSIENARSIARGLLPVCNDAGGLASALRELASRSRDLYGLEVNFRGEVRSELVLDETDSSHLYRIAQEALTNSARHGHATSVDIFLIATEDSFLLCVADNGEGIRPPMSPYKGIGLKIMKYRAGMIGARFEIAPNQPRGTVVRVTGGTTIDSGQSSTGVGL
jgi:two-component system sensor kinase FixL